MYTPTGSVQDCNILDNGEYAFYLSAKYDPTTVVNATNNWWGVADSAAIEAIVYHHADSSYCPVLDYLPFAENLIEYADSTIVSVPETSAPILPSEFTLRQNYPNPFNPTTNIEFYIPRRSHVSIIIYNLLGQQVKQLLNDEKPAGHHMTSWDGADSHGCHVSTGIYFYRLRAGDYTETRKMLLLR